VNVPQETARAASLPGDAARFGVAAGNLDGRDPTTVPTGTHAASAYDDVAATERAVLGAMMVEPSCVPAVAAIAQPVDYLDPRHRLIARAILSEHAERGASPMLAIVDRLKAGVRLEEAGGPTYLLDLQEQAAPCTSARRYAEMVHENADRRRIAERCAEAAQAARQGAPIPELLSMIDAARPAPSTHEARPGRGWRLVREDPPVEWLADGLVPVAGLVVLAAEPNVGKTLLVLDLALRAEHGLDWLGQSVRPFSTVYVAAEGGRGLGARMRAWAVAHPAAMPADGCYLHVDEGPLVDLGRADAVAQLEQVLASAAAPNGGRRPDVVVIDTLALALPGADENDSGAMGAALAALAELRRRHGVAVVVLHHTRKPPADGRKGSSMHDLRGSSALAGAADVVLLAQEGREGVRTLRTVKVRDGELLPTLHYAIRSQDTGRTLANGRAETGPVVLPAEAAPVVDKAPDQEAKAAQLEADVAAVVAVVAREHVHQKDTIGKLANLPRDRGRVAVEVAEGRGFIKPSGTTVDRRYVVVGCGANAQSGEAPPADSRHTTFARAPHTPHAGGGANGSRHPDAIPAERRESARVGVNGANGPDDGLPEQPGGRRPRAARDGAA
jgi:hypothetical protein